MFLGEGLILVSLQWCNTRGSSLISFYKKKKSDKQSERPTALAAEAYKEDPGKWCCLLGSLVLDFDWFRLIRFKQM